MGPLPQSPVKLSLTLSDGQLTGKYEIGTSYDEMVAEPGRPRASYRRIFSLLQTDLCGRPETPPGPCAAQFPRSRHHLHGAERRPRDWKSCSPSTSIPRVIAAQTWARLEAGLKQRVQALNLFLRRRLRPAAHPEAASGAAGDRALLDRLHARADRDAGAHGPALPHRRAST